MNQLPDPKRMTSVDMTELLERTLHKLPAKTPPSGMFGRIREAIDAEIQLRSLRRKAAGFAAGLVGFGAVIVGFWSFLAQELAQSSFVEYLKIFWSDRDILLANWKDSAASLLESLPVANLMVWLLVSFFAIGLAWMLFQTWDKSRMHGISHHSPMLT